MSEDIINGMRFIGSSACLCVETSGKVDAAASSDENGGKEVPAIISFQTLVGDLQKRVGSQPKIAIRNNLSSVGRPHECNLVLWSVATRLSDIVRLIRAASSMSLHVRAIGAGHAPLEFLADSYSLVIGFDIQEEDRLFYEEKISPSDEKKRHYITVKAGVSVLEFQEFCKLREVCLPLIPDSQKHTLIGALCIGGQGMLARSLLQIRVVDHEGQLCTYRHEAFGADLFAMSQCSLGLLGIVYDATFEVTKAYQINMVAHYVQLSDLTSTNHKRLFWLPLNSLGRAGHSAQDIKLKKGKSKTKTKNIDSLLLKWDPLDDEVVLISGSKIMQTDLTHTFEDNWKLLEVEERLPPNLSSAGSASHYLHGKLRQCQPHGVAQIRDIYYSQNFLSLPDYFGYHLKVIFDPKETYSILLDALLKFGALLKDLAERGCQPVACLLSARILGNCDGLLSPCAKRSRLHGAAKLCALELRQLPIESTFTTSDKLIKTGEFFGAVQRLWISLPNVRFHWGNNTLNLDHELNSRAHQDYAEELEQFRRVQLSKDIDPRGIFTTKLLANLFVEMKIDEEKDEIRAIYEQKNQVVIFHYTGN